MSFDMRRCSREDLDWLNQEAEEWREGKRQAWSVTEPMPDQESVLQGSATPALVPAVQMELL